MNNKGEDPLATNIENAGSDNYRSGNKSRDYNFFPRNNTLDFAVASPVPVHSAPVADQAPAPLSPSSDRDEKDVLLGRGNMSWKGNKRFQEVVRQKALKYQHAGTRYEKTHIVFEIIGAVKAWGGRFLYPLNAKDSGNTASKSETQNDEDAKKNPKQRGDTHQQWTDANHVQIRRKVGQALRYQMTELGKSETPDSPSSMQKQPKIQTSSPDSEARGKRKSYVNNEDDIPERKRSFGPHSTPYASHRKAKYTGDGGSDSDDSSSSLDVSLLLDLMDLQQQKESYDRIRNRKEGKDLDIHQKDDTHDSKPLMSNREILVSLGYDHDSIFHGDHDSQERGLIKSPTTKATPSSHRKSTTLHSGGTYNRQNAEYMDASISEISDYDEQLIPFGDSAFMGQMPPTGAITTSVKFPPKRDDDNNPSTVNFKKPDRPWK